MVSIGIGGGVCAEAVRGIVDNNNALATRRHSIGFHLGLKGFARITNNSALITLRWLDSDSGRLTGNPEGILKLALMGLRPAPPDLTLRCLPR